MNMVEIAQNMQIKRWGNGIKLIESSQTETSKFNLAELLNQPFNVYFLNTESEIHLINETCAKANNFLSEHDAKGKSVLCYMNKESAISVLNDDKFVLVNQSRLFVENSDLQLKDGGYYHYLTIKSPWYNSQNQVIGIFGCSVALTKQPLTLFLEHMDILDMLSSKSTLAFEHFDNPLRISKREKECLYHLVYGKTAKQIGKTIGLSYRTVESYIENIKNKLGVCSKSELIERVIKDFISFPE